MPVEYTKILKQNRLEEADQHEKDKNHLINAEKAYLEIAKMYDFNLIECIKDNNIKSIDDINKELYDIVEKLIN